MSTNEPLTPSTTEAIDLPAVSPSTSTAILKTSKKRKASTQSSLPDTTADAAASPTKRARAPGAGQKWTASELEQLLEAAIGSAPGIKDFEGQIEGRTAAQCANNWKNRIKPFLVEALRRRAEEGGAGAGAPGKKKGE